MQLAIKVERRSESNYRAWCPALPGCTATGTSTDDVRQKMDGNIRGYLASLDAAVPPVLDQQVVEV